MAANFAKLPNLLRKPYKARADYAFQPPSSLHAFADSDIVETLRREVGTALKKVS